MVYDFAERRQTPIQKLRRLVEENPGVARAAGVWDWLKPIIGETLDAYVDRELAAPAPSLPAWPARLVEEHLAEAARLLDICLVQRREIYQLESDGILAALDICLSLQTLEHDRATSLIQLAASARQAGLPKDAGVADLNARFDAQANALAERLALHSEPGSALNYGRRVAFLRPILLDNLRLAWARLTAARRGLSENFGLARPEPSLAARPAGMPFLDFLLDWTRATAKAMDVMDEVYDVHLHLVADNLAPALKAFLASPSKNRGATSGTFKLSEEHLEIFYDSDGPGPLEGDAVRLLGLDVAIVYGENRLGMVPAAKDLGDSVASGGKATANARAAHLAFQSEILRRLRSQWSPVCRLTLPKPRNETAAALVIGAAPVWSEGPARDQFRPNGSREIANASPIGEWRYEFDVETFGPEARERFSGLSMLGDYAQANYLPAKFDWDWLTIKEVVLMLRVARRRRKG